MKSIFLSPMGRRVADLPQLYESVEFPLAKGISVVYEKKVAHDDACLYKMQGVVLDDNIYSIKKV